ncbi:MAG: acyltransferase [Bacillota bacterium]
MRAKLEEVNILRALGAAAVILIHTSAEPVVALEKGSFLLVLFSVLNRAMQFAVPAFIFISGFVLTVAYQEKKLIFLPFLHKRLAAVLGPYIFWSIAYYLFFIYAGFYTFSWNFFLKKLFLGDMVYHLYFVALIVQFYFIFIILRLAFNRFNNNKTLFLIFIFNLIFFKWGQFKYADRFFMQYIFFFALGCYLARYFPYLKQIMSKTRFYLLLTFVGINTFFIWQFYQYHVLHVSMSGLLIKTTWVVFSSVSILFYFYLAILINDRDLVIKRFLQSIGDSSYYIYLSHPLVLIVSQKIYSKLGFISITGGFLFNTLFIILTVIPASILYIRWRERVIPIR